MWQKKIQRGRSYHRDYRRHLFALCPSGTKISKATLPQFWPRRSRVLAFQDCCFYWFSSVLVGKPSNHNSLPFQLVHDELRHRVGVQIAKGAWRSPFEAAFEKAPFKQRIINQFLLIPTAQVVHVCLHERMWIAVHWNHANIGTKRIRDPSQDNHLFIHVAAETIQDDKIGCCPRTEMRPRCVRFALQTLCHLSREASPKWRPCWKCGDKCRWVWLTKRKTTINN